MWRVGEFLQAIFHPSIQLNDATVKTDAICWKENSIQSGTEDAIPYPDERGYFQNPGGTRQLSYGSYPSGFMPLGAQHKAQGVRLIDGQR